LTSLPIDFGDERIREYYQEYNAENGKYLTDTDGDGLKNYEEIAFESKLIKFDPDLVLPTFEYCYDYLKETDLYLGVKDGFERFFTTGTYNEIRSIRILPINSDPVSKDGDGDGYDDYYEVSNYHKSNPLVCDIVEIRLKGNFISIENPSNIEVSLNFGGNQSWFYSDTIKDRQLAGGGCGIIAACDSLLYLQKYHGDVYTPVSTNSGKIAWSEYDNFVRDFSLKYVTPIDVLKITNSIMLLTNEDTMKLAILVSNGTLTWGTTLPFMKSGVNTYLAQSNSSYEMMYEYADKDSKLQYINRISSQLKKNIPSILMFGYPYYFDSSNKTIPIGSYTLAYDDVNADGTRTHRIIDGAHFMTITGIRVDTITEKTILTLSSWGNEIEIDMDVYLNNIGLTGGLAYYIHK
jgi:hypothetical protein